MSNWLVPRHELTPEQLRAIELSPHEHRAIIGGPGSGKTQILLHRARYLCDSQRVPPERFRLLVYTNVLRDYIRSALTLLKLPEESVITFDHWCRQVYQKHISPQLPYNKELKMHDFETIRASVRQKIAGGQLTLPLLDFVLVDEAQDLEEEHFAMMVKAARHITVCLDGKQQIYPKGSTEAGILHKLGIRRRNISLIDAFRVSPYLVEVAAPLIADEVERNAFRHQTRQPQIERETPLVYFARSIDDEAVRLHDVLRQRLLKDDRIGILVPQNAQIYSWAKRLHGVGVEVETPQKKEYAAKHDFNTNRPKLMTYHSAKGLTFDSVFLPRLVSGSFKMFSADRVERLVFVALTRATKWAYFSTVLGNSCDFLEKLLPLEKTRQLTVQRGDQAAAATASTPQVKPAASTADDLDFL